MVISPGLYDAVAFSWERLSTRLILMPVFFPICSATLR